MSRLHPTWDMNRGPITSFDAFGEKPIFGETSEASALAIVVVLIDPIPWMDKQIRDQYHQKLI